MSKAQNNAPAWGFYNDTVERWAYSDNVFSKEECEKIVEIGKSYSLKTALTIEEMQTGNSSGIRDSNVAWLNPCGELDFVYRKLTDVVLSLNSSYFNFHLTGFTESLQFTEYKSPGGFYGHHVDKIYGGRLRKLSIVVQLSDEADYEGGDLEMLDNYKPEKLSRKQGTLLAFPSYTSHQVTPLTSGTRYSLVGWISGNQFK
jgi:PKHD-type hydroxylase